MIQGLAKFLDWVAAYNAYRADPDSDPELILAVEEHYEVEL